MNKLNRNHLLLITTFFVTNSFAEYSVKKGDTLANIAQEHYGNWNKWKELWQKNSTLIKNPNLIYPGQILNLAETKLLGKDQTLVKSSVMVASSSRGRSNEWRLLPEQRWEKFIFKKNPEVDPDGFDKRSKIIKPTANQTVANIVVHPERLVVEGEIVNARTEYGQVFLGEQVFINAVEQLQVGSIYSVTAEPNKIISERDSRVGFAYELMGKVKIIGVRDGLFIGTVITQQKPIYRNHILIPEVHPMKFPKAVPAPEAIKASVILPEFMTTTLVTDQQLVIIDVGNNDGVTPGMVFRRYMKTDQNTGQTITTKDYLIESELQVLESKENFSIAIILQSRTAIHNNDPVIALTDLKDFQRNDGMQTYIQELEEDSQLDKLDKLDNSQGVGETEDKDLEQLENINPDDFDSSGGLKTESDQDLPPLAPEEAPPADDADLDAIDAETPKTNDEEMVMEAPPEAPAPAPDAIPPNAIVTEPGGIDEIPPDLPVETPVAPESLPSSGATSPAPAKTDPFASPSPSPTPSPAP